MPRWRKSPKATKLADLVASGDRTIKMIILYVIRSVQNKYRYVGITNDLDDRMARHNSGRSSATKGFAPFLVIHTETFSSMLEARVREKFLKSGVGRKFLDGLES